MSNKNLNIKFQHSPRRRKTPQRKQHDRLKTKRRDKDNLHDAKEEAPLGTSAAAQRRIG